jgi:hypothetical protein
MYNYTIMGNTVGSRHYPSDTYLVGLFDGDGSVVATLERYNSERFPYRVRLKLNFTQHARHIKTLELIQGALGNVGAIRVNKRKNLAELVVQDRHQVQTVLARLKEHLLIKKKQAQLALQVLEMLKTNEKHKPSTLSNGAYTRILNIVRDIRSLNSPTGGKRRDTSV